MSNGYPEIEFLKLGFGYGRLENRYGSSCKNNGIWEILIDSGLKGSKRSVLRGIASHEVSHVIENERLNKSAQRKDKILYRFRLYKELKERETDLDVILRGHGEDLLSYKMFGFSRGYNVTGLSVNETKKLIRQER